MSTARLARYRIERLLGEGANARVHLATDLELDRPVALKLIDLSSAKTGRRDEVRTRFQREAKLTARLQHPNVVVVYDYGESEELLFLAMEYVSAGNLAQRLAPGSVPFPVTERLLLAAEIADAIAHAHERGVLHRDLKPANVLLTASGDAKVSDFGIGRLLSGDVDLTATGEMLGSPAYMSPEQARGERLDAKSDIFGLGVVLFHLLTGRKPFDGRSLPVLVGQIQNEEPPDPCRVEPGLPSEIGPILLRCLAKDKLERYSDAGRLAADLRSLLPAVAEPGRDLSSGNLRRLLSDSGGVGTRRLAEPGLPAEADVETLRRPAALEILPTIPTWRRPRQRRLIIGAAAVALIAVAVVLALGRRAPSAAAPVRPRPTRRAPPATIFPTPVPSPKPVTADAFLAALHASWSAPPATTAHAVARTGVELHILPGMASVFLDGKFVGVADDWAGHEVGSVLAFQRDWRHVVRVVHPGYGDLEIDLLVTKGAPDAVAVVAESLSVGTSSAPDGLARHLDPPDARTARAVRIDVSPPGTRVSVDGAPAGTAAALAHKDLELEGPAVHTLTLAAEGAPPASVRVLVSDAVKTPRVTIRRKL